MTLEQVLPVALLCAVLVLILIGVAFAAWIFVQALQLVISLAIVIRQNTGLFQDADLARELERRRIIMATAPKRPPTTTRTADGDEPPPAPGWSDAEIVAGIMAGRTAEQIADDIANGRPVATTGDIEIPAVDVPPPAANNGEAYVSTVADGERIDESITGTGMYAEDER